LVDKDAASFPAIEDDGDELSVVEAQRRLQLERKSKKRSLPKKKQRPEANQGSSTLDKPQLQILLPW
jgi:hypothetical protein